MIVGWDSGEMTCRLLIKNDSEEFSYEWRAERQLAHDMLGYLRDRLKEHDMVLTDIGGIVAYRGPGSYTGLRIGLTVLNTLAESLSVPIVGEIGEDWFSVGLERLSAGQDDGLVLPEYGGEAHITTQRK